jgi:hypothetical protein
VETERVDDSDHYVAECSPPGSLRSTDRANQFCGLLFRALSTRQGISFELRPAIGSPLRALTHD